MTPPLPPDQFLAVAAVFLSVALLVGLAAWRLLAAQTPERRRLREIVPTQEPAYAAALPRDGASARGREGARRSLSAWIPKSFRDMTAAERRLANAGYRSPRAVTTFAAAQVAVPIACAGTALLWFGAGQDGLVAAAFSGVVGYLLPGFYVDRLVSKRRRQIRNGLPDVLDLLIVCLEAGSSLDQAVVKAGDELALAYPALAEELRILTTETRAGKPRMEAFRNLAQRTKVDDVRALVAMLVQTDRFGTSVGQALRTLADSMRTRRRQDAEEKAGKVGVKLVFPLVLCLFPAFFIVILGPALIKLMAAMSQIGR